MRVLHFYKSYYPERRGGIEQVIHQIACSTQSHGVETDVLTLGKESSSEPTQMNGYRAHTAKRNLEVASTGLSLSVFQKFRALARVVDLIHFHFPWPQMDLVHLAIRANKPTVVTYHSDIVRQTRLLKLYQPLMSRFLGSVDRIVATSPNYAASSDTLIRYADKVSIIPIGLDRKSYPEVNSAKLAYWKQRLGAKFFLFVGVLRYYKGIHTLIEAAAKEDFVVAITGSGTCERELMAHAARRGADRVHFLGAIPDEDKVALLSLCCGIVFPSNLRSEAFGITLVEGAMFGKPLISCEIGTGTSFVNVAGQTGLVVAKDDSTALRHAMLFLWGQPAVAAAMGQRAALRYETLFTGAQMGAAHFKLYAELNSSRLRSGSNA